MASVISNIKNKISGIGKLRESDLSNDKKVSYTNLKTFLLALEARQSQCVHLISENLFKLFIFVLIFIFILSYITGKLETRTRGQLKAFLRNLPLKMAILLILLKTCNIFTISIFCPTFYKKAISLTIEKSYYFILITLFFIVFTAIFKPKLKDLFDFYSLFSYSFLVYLLAFVKCMYFSKLTIQMILTESMLFFMSYVLSSLIGYAIFKTLKLTFSFEEKALQ